MTGLQKLEDALPQRALESDDTKIGDLELICQSNDRETFNEILLKYRDRLRKIVAMRINPKLQGRIDASDIIQDTYVEASRTLESYLEKPKQSVFLWLRHLAGEKLIQLHRFHFDAQKRNVEREVSLSCEMPQASSYSLASRLIGSASTPSNIAIRNENKLRLEKALDQMNPVDREVLVLRHFEQLSGKESAAVMGLSHNAIKKRYVRALEKLARIIQSLDDTTITLSNI